MDFRSTASTPTIPANTRWVDLKHPAEDSHDTKLNRGCGPAYACVAVERRGVIHLKRLQIPLIPPALDSNGTCDAYGRRLKVDIPPSTPHQLAHVRVRWQTCRHTLACTYINTYRGVIKDSNLAWSPNTWQDIGTRDSGDISRSVFFGFSQMWIPGQLLARFSNTVGIWGGKGESGGGGRDRMLTSDRWSWTP